MLTLDNVSTGYDATNVLHGVSITAQPGELTVVLGANGSGKTTLFKTISGLMRVRAGSIDYEGRQLHRARPNAIVKAGIAHCPEGRHLFGKMSVEKNLRLGSYPHRNSSRTEEIYAEVLDMFPILKEKAKQPAGSLSGGQQQRVATARPLASKPAIILADEPTGNLDSKTSADVLGLLKTTSQKFHQTLVMITHNSEIAQLADRIIRIEDGKIVQ